MADNHGDHDLDGNDLMEFIYNTVANQMEAATKRESHKTQAKKIAESLKSTSSAVGTSNQKRSPYSQALQSLDKEQIKNVLSEISSVGQKMIAEHPEAGKATRKQVLDLKKSYEEKTNYVANLKNSVIQFYDTIQREKESKKESGAK